MNAHFFVKVGQHLTNLSVSVGRNGSHVRNGCTSPHFGGLGMELVGDVLDSQVDSSLNVCWVEASFNFFESFLVNSSSQDSGSCSPISCLVIRLVCHIFH